MPTRQKHSGCLLWMALVLSLNAVRTGPVSSKEEYIEDGEDYYQMDQMLPEEYYIGKMNLMNMEQSDDYIYDYDESEEPKEMAEEQHEGGVLNQPTTIPASFGEHRKPTITPPPYGKHFDPRPTHPYEESNATQAPTDWLNLFLNKTKEWFKPTSQNITKITNQTSNWMPPQLSANMKPYADSNIKGGHVNITWSSRGPEFTNKIQQTNIGDGKNTMGYGGYGGEVKNPLGPSREDASSKKSKLFPGEDSKKTKDTEKEGLILFFNSILNGGKPIKEENSVTTAGKEPKYTKPDNVHIEESEEVNYEQITENFGITINDDKEDKESVEKKKEHIEVAQWDIEEPHLDEQEMLEAGANREIEETTEEQEKEVTEDWSKEIKHRQECNEHSDQKEAELKEELKDGHEKTKEDEEVEYSFEEEEDDSHEDENEEGEKEENEYENEEVEEDEEKQKQDAETEETEEEDDDEYNEIEEYYEEEEEEDDYKDTNDDEEAEYYEDAEAETKTEKGDYREESKIKEEEGELEEEVDIEEVKGEERENKQNEEKEANKSHEDKKEEEEANEEDEAVEDKDTKKEGGEVDDAAFKEEYEDFNKVEEITHVEKITEVEEINKEEEEEKAAGETKGEENQKEEINKVKEEDLEDEEAEGEEDENEKEEAENKVGEKDEEENDDSEEESYEYVSYEEDSFDIFDDDFSDLSDEEGEMDDYSYETGFTLKPKEEYETELPEPEQLMDWSLVNPEEEINYDYQNQSFTVVIETTTASKPKASEDYETENDSEYDSDDSEYESDYESEYESDYESESDSGETRATKEDKSKSVEDKAGRSNVMTTILKHINSKAKSATGLLAKMVMNAKMGTNKKKPSIKNLLKRLTKKDPTKPSRFEIHVKNPRRPLSPADYQPMVKQYVYDDVYEEDGYYGYDYGTYPYLL